MVRETTRWSLAPNETGYEDSFVARSPQAGQEEPAIAGQGEPIEARRVEDDEADIEAQVQNRMKTEAEDIADMVHKHLMANAAVAEVQPSAQDASSLTTQDQDEQTRQQQKRKRYCLLAIGLLAIIAAVGAGLGIAFSKKDDPAPTPAEQKCSFCFDGSTPPNLDTNEIEGQSCAEFSEKQIQLDSTDSKCEYGQVVAWYYCQCPTLPPPPKNPRCTLCANGEAPLGVGCVDLSTYAVHIGEDPLVSCEDLAASFLETGCSCGSGNTIEAFQAFLEPLSGEALSDQNSAQFKALDWIANVDRANLSVDATLDETIKTRYVAATLYYALGGRTWAAQYNFLSEGDICRWNQADTYGLKYGIICGSDGNVETLRLRKFQRKNELIASLFTCMLDS
jgi:hypothetical protein